MKANNVTSTLVGDEFCSLSAIVEPLATILSRRLIDRSIVLVLSDRQRLFSRSGAVVRRVADDQQ